VLVISCFGHWVWETYRKGSGKLVILVWLKHNILTNYFSQCNMDYLFASSIATCGLRQITISYDVGCQWFTKFWNRAKSLPAALGLSLPSMTIRALVPKFHLQSHIEACQSAFSFNFFKGGARTEGEGVERNWDELNGQGPSTSEMLPCARWNTLDDCCGWVNWRKTMGLGALSLFLSYIIYINSEKCRKPPSQAAASGYNFGWYVEERFCWV
jgi:Kyakuja-Dileera-Zisupton transposase